MRRIAGFILLGGAGLMLSSCGQEPPGQQKDKQMVVLVSVLPQAYLVERIGSEHLAVEVLIEPGQSPHIFEPKPRQLARLKKVRLYFLTGIPFEETLLPKLQSSHKNLRIVDTRRNIEPDLLAEHYHEQDSGMDPHLWLDPKLAKIQAGTIAEELCRADPDHQDEYRRNLKALEDDLDQLDNKIAEALEPVKGRTFYVFHPAFGYFARAYGLKQKALEVSGKSPTARQISELIEQARAQGVKVIFVQPQFSQRAAQAIAEKIGGRLLPIDPLAKDYCKNLEEVAKRIRTALDTEVR